MTPTDYVRPAAIPEALRALKRGTALAGGTTLAPRARHYAALVDLQALGLETLAVEAGQVRLGAMLRLQAMVEAEAGLPAALVEATRREAGLNLRNTRSLAGSVISSTGRSPLATALLALHAQVRLEPGPVQWSLDELLDRRPQELQGRLVTEIAFQSSGAVAYAGVARSPADRPVVCVAVARLEGRAPAYGVALGGFGPRAVLVPAAEAGLGSGEIEAAAQAVEAACAASDDAWASAAYRRHAAAALLRRLAAEVGR
jgi:CO/xanthine dehydrogenase FAD-binding subunit